MTRDDIIKLAREAGVGRWDAQEVAIERFADLVAAAEREACAKVCDDLEPDNRHEGAWIAGWCDGTNDCAAAIRARSTL